MWGFGRDLVRYWQLVESQVGGGFARFCRSCLWGCGFWLGLDEIFFKKIVMSKLILYSTQLYSKRKSCFTFKRRYTT